MLGSEQYGIFTTALSIATIFEMFTDFGLRDISIRNVSRSKDLTENYLGNILVWKTLLCTAIYGAMLITVHILGYKGEIRTIIYILTISAFLKNMIYTFRIFFQAHDEFGWDTLLVLIERTSLLGFGLAALFRWEALMPFTICFASVRAVNFLLTLITIRWKISPIRLKFNLKLMKKLQFEAFPLGLFFVILTVFSYIDTVMLSLMRDYHEVGLYNAAFKIYEGVAILPTVFWLVFLPRLSELYNVDLGYHRRMSIKSVKYLFIVGLPAVTYGVLFSEMLINFFFKAEFTAAIFTLQILFFGLLFQYPNWMLNATLISMNRQRVIMVFGAIGLGFKIIVNLIVIPIYGFNGSAVATVMSEFLLFLAATIYLYRYHVKMPIVKIILKPVLAASLIYAGFEWLDFIPVIPLIALTGILYIIAILLLKSFDRDEINTFMTNLKMMFGKPRAAEQKVDS
ncbi:oligosaccharide flippase family protein [candidate division KSB1 bacterium]|nr:oligosaccharide flippase family protein [candidate division KSB1 bacterium]